MAVMNINERIADAMVPAAVVAVVRPEMPAVEDTYFS